MTETPRRQRPDRSALSGAILSLLAVLSLLLLAGLPATADAEIRPDRACAAAQLKDPACPSQRFALQVSLDADEPAPAIRMLVLRSAEVVQPGPARPFAHLSDRVPASSAGRTLERPPRAA